MRTDYAQEIFETCIFVRRKSQKIVEAKNMAMEQGVAVDKLIADMSAYLDLIETIDKKLAVFKAKYEKLRDKAIEEQFEACALQQKEKEEKKERAKAKAKEKEAKKKSKKGKKKQESSSESSESEDEDEDEQEDSSQEEEKK